MNCLIVDDQEIFREIIKDLFKFDPSLNLVAECSNAVEAHQKIMEQEIDLIFLDIKMPGVNGIELAKIFEDKQPMIIFTTSSTDYAVEAFDLNVIDYLVKPIKVPRFLKAVEKAKELLKTIHKPNEDITSNWAFIRDSNTTRKIKVNDILFLEATRDYVSIFFTDNTYSIHSSLKEIEQKLPKSIFCRIHRSFIVNLNKIDTIEGKTLVINGHFVPVSSAFKADFVKKMNFL